MYAIAILDKERKVGLITRAKNKIIKKTRQRLIDVLYVKQNGVTVQIFSFL